MYKSTCYGNCSEGYVHNSKPEEGKWRKEKAFHSFFPITDRGGALPCYPQHVLSCWRVQLILISSFHWESEWLWTRLCWLNNGNNVLPAAVFTVEAWNNNKPIWLQNIANYVQFASCSTPVFQILHFILKVILFRFGSWNEYSEGTWFSKFISQALGFFYHYVHGC